MFTDTYQCLTMAWIERTSGGSYSGNFGNGYHAILGGVGRSSYGSASSRLGISTRPLKQGLTPEQREKLDNAMEEAKEKGCGARMAYNMVKPNMNSYGFEIDLTMDGKEYASYNPNGISGLAKPNIEFEAKVLMEICAISVYSVFVFRISRDEMIVIYSSIENFRAIVYVPYVGTNRYKLIVIR